MRVLAPFFGIVASIASIVSLVTWNIRAKRTYAYGPQDTRPKEPEPAWIKGMRVTLTALAGLLGIILVILFIIIAVRTIWELFA